MDEIRAHNRDLSDGYVTTTSSTEVKLTYASLLNSPFDFVPAFDMALKNVVKTLPNRPVKESADEVVCFITFTPNRSNIDRPRFITVPMLGVLANMPAILEHWAQISSTIWFHWKESSQNARLCGQKLLKAYITMRTRKNSTPESTEIKR